MAIPPHDKHLVMLDAARGIAAIGVMLLHVQKYMFPTHQLTPWSSSFTESYIAVDLFFLMSGVVISRSYESRLLDGSLSFGEFTWVRWIRLFPLYALALLVGFVYAFAKPVLNHRGAPDAGAAFGALLPNLIFFPNLLFPISGLFPFNPAAWSLSLEWIVNLVYAAFAVRWRSLTLTSIVLASGGLLIIRSLTADSIDLGWDLNTYEGGVLRILFSFTLGVIINRALSLGSLRLPDIGALPLLAGVTILVYSPFGHFGVIYELACALVLFPAFVWASCQARTSGLLVRACSELGRMSYAVYILHNAVMDVFSGAWKALLRTSPDSRPLIAAPLLVVAIIGASWLATRFVDEPLRRWLRRQAWSS